MLYFIPPFFGGGGGSFYLPFTTFFPQFFTPALDRKWSLHISPQFQLALYCQNLQHIILSDTQKSFRNCSSGYFGDKFHNFADFAGLSGSCFGVLALFWEGGESVCEVTYVWSRASVVPQTLNSIIFRVSQYNPLLSMILSISVQ